MCLYFIERRVPSTAVYDKTTSFSNSQTKKFYKIPQKYCSYSLHLHVHYFHVSGSCFLSFLVIGSEAGEQKKKSEDAATKDFKP